jgi:uncharacterized damage-inducible protein DinB
MTIPASAPAPLATRPSSDEFAPYYGKYITRVPDGDLIATLEEQLPATIELLDRFDEAGAGLRYAPGKWSVKEVVGHLADCERIFAYRALAAARSESASLPGFDENAYVAVATFDDRTLGSLLGELTAVRRATLSLFKDLSEAELSHRVVANGVPVSARALAWIIAGHELHHAALLTERYLPLLNA